MTGYIVLSKISSSAILLFEHLQLFLLLGISYISCSFASFFSAHVCTLHVCLFFLGFVLSNLVLAIQLFHNFSFRAKRDDGVCCGACVARGFEVALCTCGDSQWRVTNQGVVEL